MNEQRFFELSPTTMCDVSCGDQTHRLRWSAGQLGSIDHDDLDGERTLAALGGTSNGCVDIVDAWNRCRDELRVLTLAPRGPNDTIDFDQPTRPTSGRTAGQPRRLPRGRSQGWFMSASTYQSMSTSLSMSTGPAVGTGNDGPVDPDRDLIDLFSLGSPVAERLAATVATEWAERIDAGAVTSADGPTLEIALTGRVWPAMQAWSGAQPTEVTVDMIAPGEQPGVAKNDAGHFAVRLPFRWLNRVWSTSMTVIAGRLVLDAEWNEDELQLTTTDLDGQLSTIRMQL